MRIFYAGDSPAGGPANYLLGILKYSGAATTHVPPSEILKPSVFKSRFDAFILSDFSKKNVPAEPERALLEQVERGAGLLMVGGWGSFSGPFGGWQGSELEKFLPVKCLGRDDRLNFPGGASVCLNKKHAILRGIPFYPAPAVCGLNQLKLKPSSHVVLSARRILTGPSNISLEKKSYPLLVVDKNPAKRVAALATDLAPHWCGGLVDWGGHSQVLPVNLTLRIEVGLLYIRFVSSLIAWLTGR